MEKWEGGGGVSIGSLMMVTKTKGADLDMVQCILVNDFDFSADERLCGSIVMSHNVLSGFCVAAAALPNLAPLVLQLLQFLPVISVIGIILI